MILLGTETDNVVNEDKGGYNHVSEYIPIAQPNISTLAKLQQLRASQDCTGDRELTFEIQNGSFSDMRYEAIDAIIVGIQTQRKYLTITKKKKEEEKKKQKKKKQKKKQEQEQKKWTRKMVLLTDGESPIVIEGWQRTAKEIKALVIITTIMLAISTFPAVMFTNSRTQRR